MYTFEKNSCIQFGNVFNLPKPLIENPVFTSAEVYSQNLNKCFLQSFL